MSRMYSGELSSSTHRVHSLSLSFADFCFSPSPRSLQSSSLVLEVRRPSLLDASSPPLASKDLSTARSPGSLPPSSLALLFFRE